MGQRSAFTKAGTKTEGSTVPQPVAMSNPFAAVKPTTPSWLLSPSVTSTIPAFVPAGTPFGPRSERHP